MDWITNWTNSLCAILLSYKTVKYKHHKIVILQNTNEMRGRAHSANSYTYYEDYNRNTINQSSDTRLICHDRIKRTLWNWYKISHSATNNDYLWSPCNSGKQQICRYVIEPDCPDVGKRPCFVASLFQWVAHWHETTSLGCFLLPARHSSSLAVLVPKPCNNECTLVPARTQCASCQKGAGYWMAEGHGGWVAKRHKGCTWARGGHGQAVFSSLLGMGSGDFNAKISKFTEEGHPQLRKFLIFWS